MNRSMTESYMLRLPDGLREAIKLTAARNRRSMNAEILLHLESIFRGQQTMEADAQNG
jgi:plasmid stability protein